MPEITGRLRPPPNPQEEFMSHQSHRLDRRRLADRSHTDGARAAAPSLQAAQITESRAKGADTMNAHSFVGMWVTADGHIRHELLPERPLRRGPRQQEERLSGPLHHHGQSYRLYRRHEDCQPILTANFIDGVPALTREWCSTGNDDPEEWPALRPARGGRSVCGSRISDNCGHDQ